MSKTAITLSGAGLVIGLLLAFVSPLAGGFVGAAILATAGLVLAVQLEREVAEFRPTPQPVRTDESQQQQMHQMQQPPDVEKPTRSSAST